MSDAPTQPMPSGPESLAGERYRLHRLLGTGGMGLVLQATDTLLDREVAVKLLADNLAADDTARERFLREARAAASISDLHVVQVHDVGEDAGRPYLVMELIDGPALSDELARRGPLDPEEVMGVAADALAGIGSAHAAGLLHRDVKPGNLLRTPSGLIKVTDFGVAQAADAPELTRTGMVIGTASYLAPERRRGEPATVRTDLYALGATLVELLTGQRLTGKGGIPSVPDDTPAHLAHCIDRLLASDPQQRPASAEAALTLLAGEIDTDPRPVSSLTRRGTTGDPDQPTGTYPAVPDSGADAEAGPATDLLDPAPAPEVGTEPGSRPMISWQLAVLVAVALLLVGVAFQVLGGQEESPAEAPPGVERSDDRAETARNLADWLQQRAD